MGRNTTRAHPRTHTRTFIGSATHIKNKTNKKKRRRQEAEIISSVLQRGLVCFFSDFSLSTSLWFSKRRIWSGLLLIFLSFLFFSVCFSSFPVSVTHSQKQSTVRSGDSGAATVTDPSEGLIQSTIVVLKDPPLPPRVWAWSWCKLCKPRSPPVKTHSSHSPLGFVMVSVCAPLRVQRRRQEEDCHPRSPLESRGGEGGW